MLSTPLSSKARWFRIGVPEDAALLAIENGSARLFDVYFVSDGRILRQYLSGLRQPLTTRGEDFPGFLYRIPSTEKPLDVLLHDRAAWGSSILPLRFLGEREFRRYGYSRHLLHGAFYGTAAILVLYSCVLFGGTRQSAFLYFAIYAAGLTALIAVLDGFLPFYLFDANPRALERAIPCLTFATLAGLILWGNALLRLSVRAPTVALLARGLLVVVAIHCLAAALVPESIFFPLLRHLSLLVMTVLVGIGIFAVRRGFDAGVAWLTTMLLPVILLTLNGGLVSQGHNAIGIADSIMLSLTAQLLAPFTPSKPDHASK